MKLKTFAVTYFSKSNLKLKFFSTQPPQGHRQQTAVVILGDLYSQIPQLDKQFARVNMNKC